MRLLGLVKETPFILNQSGSDMRIFRQWYWEQRERNNIFVRENKESKSFSTAGVVLPDS